ncbi:hypothetical protein JOB18_018735 [Solea senegalensis]|uniref:Uncharacterized protein n=1 Tax=Solea senegalensis TaxID=28829 RepID=A0AAV6SQY7_SOLSE|nr:hypothetical protein JOB18_018735 [Solea senegalensis]
MSKNSESNPHRGSTLQRSKLFVGSCQRHGDDDLRVSREKMAGLIAWEFFVVKSRLQWRPSAVGLSKGRRFTGIMQVLLGAQQISSSVPGVKAARADTLDRDLLLPECQANGAHKGGLDHCQGQASVPHSNEEC